MFLKHPESATDQAGAVLSAAEAAARAIPPAFPLEATVAVNPFLGQSGLDLPAAAARLARVAGVRLTRPRAEFRALIADGTITDDDLAAAFLASPSALKPADLALFKAKAAQDPTPPRALPTVAELAAEASGTDWPAVIDRCLGLWAAGHFDRGQALWTPAPGLGAFDAWRAWATQDLTPEIAGLSSFCAQVARVPDTAERATLRAAMQLGLSPASAESVFHRLLMEIGGWAQHARGLAWQAELAGGSDSTLTDLLAIRLVWEAALLAHVPQVAEAWAATVAEHARPAEPTQDQVIDALLQEAAERAWQRDLSARLAAPAPLPAPARPRMQAAFCIDVRSEVFRRALEAQEEGIVTLGFAGFFGLPVSHRPEGSVLPQAHLPVLLSPALTSQAGGSEAAEDDARITARAKRAWGRFRQAAVSSFAFVEAAGPLYGGRLVRDALALGQDKTAAPAPRLQSTEGQVPLAAGILRAMGLAQGHAPLVLLVGHGAQVANNPHESAYHCGACGGQTGEVSARLLAQLLNDPAIRAGLPAEGIEIPADTVFVAGLHDTTTDSVTLFAGDLPVKLAEDVAQDLVETRRWLARAGLSARAERARRHVGATPASLIRRASDWAELRPEWGLAGCAAFIAAPRARTRGRDLGGRVFLQDYDWQADPGHGVLELILTAPVVVASWISLQYYGSSVAPAAFGGGNKLIHNVVGGIGVIEGNGGGLRPGLPWQAVHDGETSAHEALRLTVMIEAPRAAITGVLDRHPSLRALFDHGWLHLIALDQGQPVARWSAGQGWV